MEVMALMQPSGTGVANLKTCVVNSGVSNDLCSTYLDAQGAPTQALKDQLQNCGGEIMAKCPVQTLSLIAAMGPAQAALQAGTPLSTSQAAALTQKTQALLACVTQSSGLSDSCDIIMEAEELDIDTDGDEAFSRDGQHGHGDNKSSHDHDGGAGGVIVVFVLLALVAAVAAGVTYYIMRRKRQAQMLSNQLEMGSAADVVVQGRPVDSAPTGSAVVYANVPAQDSFHSGV